MSYIDIEPEDLDEINSLQPIIDASCDGDFETVKKLVENGAKINASQFIDSPLQIASLKGKLEVVKYLVENGADIAARNNCAVRCASRGGHLEVVKYLVENDADIHSGDEFPIFIASYLGHLEVVKYLLEQGAHIYESTFRWTARQGHLEVIKCLVENGAYFGDMSNDILPWWLVTAEIEIVIYLKSLNKKTGQFQTKPDNIIFRDFTTCPISREQLTDEIEKLGCSKCLNVFNRKCLEEWFNTQSKMSCPCCRGINKFYIV